MTAQWLWSVILIGILATRGEVKAAPDSTLIPFAMEDQFKQAHADSSFRGFTLVVLVANKGGSKYSRLWSPALRDSLLSWSLADDVKLLGVADMAGVPFFIKGLVRGKLPKNPKDWMLLDWKGRFADAYACTDDTCNVLIFDAQSQLKHRLEVGAVTTAQLDSIRSLVVALRGSPPSQPADSVDTVSPASVR
jgi:hypothetical protein